MQPVVPRSVALERMPRQRNIEDLVLPKDWLDASHPLNSVGVKTDEDVQRHGATLVHEHAESLADQEKSND